MEAIFIKLLNMSIAASWLVLAVLVVRLLLRKAPKWVHCLLWGIVGLRLVWPFSLESILSLIPSAETVPENITTAPIPQINSGVPIINNTINPIIQNTFAPAPSAPAASFSPVQIAAWIWLAGVAAMAIYAVVSYLRIRGQVGEAVPQQKNVWLCDRIETPFILGVFRPRIYLPSGISLQDAEFVIAHENAHLQRRDHLWKPLGFALLTLYWINPVLWLAYILLCRDIEFACDEKVLKQQGSEIKKPYSEALINCSVPRRMISACPVAFGEVGVKERIKSVLNYKKPAFWIILVALVACIALAVCFLTDPIKQDDVEPSIPTEPQPAIPSEYTAYATDKLDLLLEKGGNTCLLWNAQTHPEPIRGTYTVEDDGDVVLKLNGEEQMLSFAGEDGFISRSDFRYGDLSFAAEEAFRPWYARSFWDPLYSINYIDLDNDLVMECMDITPLLSVSSAHKHCMIRCYKLSTEVYRFTVEIPDNYYLMNMNGGLYLCRVYADHTVTLLNLNLDFLRQNSELPSASVIPEKFMQPSVSSTDSQVAIKLREISPFHGGLSIGVVMTNLSEKGVLINPREPLYMEFDGSRKEVKAELRDVTEPFELLPGQSATLIYRIDPGQDVLAEGDYCFETQFIHDNVLRNLQVKFRLARSVDISPEDSPIWNISLRVNNIRFEEDWAAGKVYLADPSKLSSELMIDLSRTDGSAFIRPVILGIYEWENEQWVATKHFTPTEIQDDQWEEPYTACYSLHYNVPPKGKYRVEFRCVDTQADEVFPMNVFFDLM